MSIWYKTGTIAVTNGSATVTGTGTAWVANVRRGDALVGPAGGPYEIVAVVSDTQLTIAPAYSGANLSGQAYRIMPAPGVAVETWKALLEWQDFQQGYIDGPLAGRFGDGTLAQPGIAFGADTDTGLRRTGANALAVVAGGVDRLAVNSAGAVLNGLLTGTAVTQGATDTTPGRLLKVGDFGLGISGAMPILSDMDATNTPAGLYGFANGSGTLPLSVSQFGTVLVERYNAAFAKQTFTYNGNITGGAGRTFIRHLTTTGWGAWNEVFTQRSILGTVSQSGGVPTGAIIERGSNANGTFVRFADGTQICTRQAVIDVTTLSGQQFTFPAAFAGGRTQIHVSFGYAWGGPHPSIQMDNLRSVGCENLNWEVVLKSTGTVGSTTELQRTLALTAIGRWF